VKQKKHYILEIVQLMILVELEIAILIPYGSIVIKINGMKFFLVIYKLNLGRIFIKQ
jgi:hypothetical protein